MKYTKNISIRDHIPLKQGLRQYQREINLGGHSQIRNYIPLKQGLIQNTASLIVSLMSSDFEKYFLQKLYSFTTSYIIRTMKKIIAYKRYYADFMAKLSQPERIKIMRALLRHPIVKLKRLFN